MYSCGWVGGWVGGGGEVKGVRAPHGEDLLYFDCVCVGGAEGDELHVRGRGGPPPPPPTPPFHPWTSWPPSPSTHPYPPSTLPSPSPPPPPTHPSIPDQPYAPGLRALPEAIQGRGGRQARAELQELWLIDEAQGCGVEHRLATAGPQNQQAEWLAMLRNHESVEGGGGGGSGGGGAGGRLGGGGRAGQGCELGGGYTFTACTHSCASAIASCYCLPLLPPLTASRYCPPLTASRYCPPLLPPPTASTACTYTCASSLLLLPLMPAPVAL